MMRHVEVYRSMNMTCTTIPHLSMISRSGSMKHGHVKTLINGELPPCIFCRKPSRYSPKRRVQCGPGGMEPPSIMCVRRINKWFKQIHPHRYHLIMRMNKMEDLHALEAMDQNDISKPITAHGMERCVNCCSHS